MNRRSRRIRRKRKSDVIVSEPKTSVELDHARKYLPQIAKFWHEQNYHMATIQYNLITEDLNGQRPAVDSELMHILRGEYSIVNPEQALESIQTGQPYRPPQAPVQIPTQEGKPTEITDKVRYVPPKSPITTQPSRVGPMSMDDFEKDLDRKVAGD